MAEKVVLFSPCVKQTKAKSNRKIYITDFAVEWSQKNRYICFNLNQMWFQLCNCQQVNALPSCIEEIELGVIADFDTDIDIYIYREGAERTQKIQSTSGPAGEVVIDTTGIGEFLSENFRYLVWVTLRDDNTALEFTLAGATATSKCIELPFFGVYDGANKENYSSLPVIPVEC